MDLRLNPNLDCQTLDNIPDGIIVYTDCIDDDYEVDPALIGDGTSQTQDAEDGFQMFKEQYAEMRPHSGISDSNNKDVKGQKQQSDSSRFPDSRSFGFKQSTSNRKVGNDGYGDSRPSDLVDSYNPAPSNAEAIRGNRQDKNREELEEPVSDSSKEEHNENDDGENKGRSRKSRKPKKLVIEFKGMMKVLIP